MSEWIIVAVVGVVLLFSARKLPDMARGLGQSMRIFKAETRGMREDDQRSRSTESDASHASAAPAAVEPPAVGPGRAAGDPVGDTAPATSETRGGSERP